MNEKIKKLRSELEEELKGNILPYWMKYAPDNRYGGFVGHISGENQVLEKAPKGSVLNARILWTFSAAYRMFGDKAHQETAHRAYVYFRDHFIDREYGGVFWELDFRGKVINPRKQIYALAFGIYAMVEYYLASSRNEALATAVDLFNRIQEKSLDREKNGYIEAMNREWDPLNDLRLSIKDANERKAMNTHLHILEAYASLYRVWKTADVQQALENIIMLFLEKFINHGNNHLQLFFDDDWNLRSDHISFGHDIECSWLLYEAAEILGKRDLIDRVRPVSVGMARQNFEGLDRDYGLMNEYFPGKNRMDTDKHWWPQAEALVGYFNAWELSGEDVFAEKLLLNWAFIKEYMIDRDGGEWYWKVNRQGQPYPEDEKAGFWKCPYHNGRACMELIRRISSLPG